MQNRKLTSDQLGKKGESRFPELCVDAGLVPNGSTWDRRGWDFIVDWPHSDAALAYDSRPAPLSCLVQVKTIWTTSTAIKLRLSSVEHLAKDTRPTFIYVLRVTDNLSFADARIVHLGGDFLALVLKELRKARLKGGVPNGLYIRVPLDRWFNTIPADGESLRSAMEIAAGASQSAYMAEKQRQLRELGYERGGHFLTTTLKGDDIDHVVEAFLGLRRIDAVNTRLIESRFEIDIPIPELDGISGSIEFNPEPRDTCTILISSALGAPPFRFRGKVYGVPDLLLPAGQSRVLIKNELFDLILRADFSENRSPNAKLTMRTDGEKIGKIRTKATDWAAFYGFLAASGKQSLDIEIQFKKASQPLIGTISADRGKLAARWQRPARLSAIAGDILNRAGWPGTKLKIEDIGAASEALEVLHAMISNPTDLTRLSFTLEKMLDVIDGDVTDMLFIDRFALGDHCIAYAAEIQITAQVSEGKIVCVGSVPKFRDLARIKLSNEAYDHYIARIRERTRLKSYFAAHTADLKPVVEEVSGRSLAHSDSECAGDEMARQALLR